MTEPLLLCTDLDRTLIPNGPQTESPQARARFASLVAGSGLVLAYVTGRHRQLIQDALAEYHLPQPDFVIGDVGTTIYQVTQDGGWQSDDEWQEQIGRDWNGRTRQEVQLLLQGIDSLAPQEAAKQNMYKLSYYAELGADRRRISTAIESRLESCSINARLVWSTDEAEARGLLDILPQAAGKYHAVVRLQQRLGFSDDNTVFSGDSGNDMEVLVSPVPSVLVANAEATVREQALTGSAINGHSARLYIARGDFHGMNGNYSAGILEGIAHFHPGLTASIAGE